ncbi:MAG: T9SS type A sorting domain-containing protein [Bacteroidales bacterium]|nr:T9SS type A sorting domain-containing protein [Bacteroidales bacterium]
MQKKLLFLRGLLAILLLLPATAKTQTINIGDVITTQEMVTGVVFAVSGSGANRKVSIIELSDLGGSATYTWMSGNNAVGAPNLFPTPAVADTDLNGFINSAMMRQAIADGATSDIWNAVTTAQKNNGWYIPSLGQMRTIYLNRLSINAGLSSAGGNEFAAEEYWTSTLANATTSQWKINMSTGLRQSGPRANSLRVRGGYDAYTEDGGTTWYLHHRNCPYGLSTEEDPHQECDSYEWIDHMTYTASYTALDGVRWPAIGSIGECMVWKLLVLDLGHSSHSKIPRTECDVYNWIPNGAYPGNPIISSGTYTHPSTNADGCPQKDTLVLTINHTSTDDTTVNECDTYTWTAWKRNATTPAIQTGSTYTATPSPDPTMTWTNSDGCTHTRTLHLTIRQSEHPITNAPHVCDTYTWTAEHGDGNTYTTPGIHTYYNEYTASNGCPSRAELNLTLFQSTHIATTTEICHGNTYTWNRTDGTSADYNANSPSAGVVYPYMNGDNCPSADTLHLTVWPIITQPLNIDACISYIWNVYDGYGNLHPQGTKSATGTYNYTTTSSHGCDSNIVLNLTIHQPDADQVFNETACDSYTWPLGDGNGQTYITTTTGATHPHYNQYGCLSTNTLNITVHYSTHNTTSAVECEENGYTWTTGDGNTYNTTGTYQYPYTNGDGCSSVDTLHLAINPTKYGTYTVSACDSYTWSAGNGNTYSVNNTTDTYTYPAPSSGCDSIVTLNLTINHANASSDAEFRCSPYNWTVANYDGSGSHTVATITANGNYQATVQNHKGCDSVITMNFTVGQSSDSTINIRACGNYTWTVADYNGSNPTTRSFGASTSTSIVKRNYLNCDSTITLNLTINNHTASTFTHSACTGYQWRYCNYNDPQSERSRSYTNSNYDDSVHVRNAAGCDSIILLNLTIYPHINGDTHVVNCGPYEWHVHDANGTDHLVGLYPVSGTWAKPAQVSLTDRHGCDSSVTLYLTIVDPHTYGTHVDTACPGTIFTWNVADYNGSNQRVVGYYTVNNNSAQALHLKDHNGCDSTVTLNLTFRNPNIYTYTVDSCEHFTWTPANWDGSNPLATITHSASYTGAYPPVRDHYGCDSTITLNLTIHHNNTSTLDTSVCSSFRWEVSNGDGTGQRTVNTYSPAIGTHNNIASTHVLTNYGCDSTITLNLTVHGTTTYTLDTTTCESLFDWYVHDYNPLASQRFIRSYIQSTNEPIPAIVTDHNGCDSTIYLHLHMHTASSTTDTHETCTTYTWTVSDTRGYSPITYNIDGIGTTPATTVFNSTRNDVTATVKNIYGCDSVIRLVLIKHDATTSIATFDTCTGFTWTVTAPDGTPHTHTNSPYSTSTIGVDRITLPSANARGCDSVVILNLTVHTSAPAEHIYDTACYRYTWGVADYNGLRPTTVGTYTTNQTSVTATGHKDHYGCDSTTVLHLVIRDTSKIDLDTAVCLSTGFIWYAANAGGSPRQISGPQSQSNGLYNTTCTGDTARLTDRYGCDSIVTLNLTVHSGTPNILDIVNTCTTPFNWQVFDYGGSINRATSVPNLYANSHEVYSVTVKDAHNCDSTVTLNLTIGSPNSSTYPMTVCDTLIWTVANADGSNPHIIDTFTYNGSRTHTATVSNASGCDSVITLNLTINKSSSGTLNRTECNNYSWTVTDFGGLNPSTISLGRDTNISVIKRNQYGCDSTITLNLTVNSNTSFTLDTHACSNFQWKVRNYNDPGNRDRLRGTYTGSIYTDTAHVRNAVGCDSTILLHLTIYPLQHGDTHVVSCGPYRWYVHDGDGTEHFVDLKSISGTYSKPANVPLTDIYGCDSNVTLYLTVVDAHTYGTDNQLACPGYTYTWRVANYDGTNRRTVGYYTTNNNTAQATVIDHNGCDSTVTLNLTLRTPNISTYSVDACERFVWVPCNWDGSDPRDARTYTASNNTAQAQVIDQYGCDSVITLNLTIHHRTYSTLDTTVCTSFTWIVSDADGSNQSTIGTYVPAAGTYNNYARATVLTNYGCDSTITLNLTVRGTTHYTLDTTTCASSFTWQVGDYGSRLPSRTINTYYGSINNPNPAIVRDHRGCDSAVFLNLHMFTADSTHDTNITCNDFMWTVSDTWGNSPSNYRTDAGSIIPSNRPFESSRNDITATVKNIHGCDSVIRLILIKHDESRNDVFFDTCTGFTWTVTAPNGTIHTHEHSPYTISSNGVDQIRMTGANVYGCDSVVTLHLTIHNAQAPHHLYDTACYNYTWRISDYNGQRSTTVGTFYTDREADTARGLIDRYGCDSTVVLHLVIRDTLYGQLDTAVCQSTGFLWYASDADGTTRQIRGPQSVRQLGGLYTTTCFGDTARLRSTTGCDSVVTLNLSVYTGTTNNYDTVHTCGEPFRWQVYDHGGNVNRATATVPVLYQTSHNIYNVTVKDMHGCDSTVYLDLYVHNSATSYVETIDACYSYLWYATNSDGTIRGSYGPYTHSVLTTSVTLKDQYNCDSIVQLQINIHDSSTSVYRVDTCGSYTWRVQNYDGTGSRTVGTFTIANLPEGNDYIEHPAYHLTSSHGCDSTSTLQLYLHNPTAGRTDISSCTAYTWRVHNWDGSHEQVMGPYTTNQQGQPSARVLSQYGCDSIVRLYLNIVDKVRDTIDTAACANLTYTSSQGRQYTFNHSEVRTVDTLLAASGCDSIVTLNVTINVPSTVYQTEYACDSFVWPVDRVTYRHSTTAVGMAPDANGCNSLHELTLYIRNSTHVIDTHDVCRPYKWINNITYPVTTPASSGVTHTIHHSYAEGCDSVLTLDLHMRNIHDTVRKDTTVCDLFSWRNHSYSTSGVYTENFTPIAGCDSVVIYTVTVHRNSALTIYDTACDTYTWMVDSLAGGHRAVGTYTTSDPALTAVIPNAIGCDSTITLNLRIYHRDSSIVYDTVCDSLWWIDGRRYITSTSPNNPIYYTLHNNRYGCDSTIALHLTVKYSSTPYRIVNQTVCDRYDWVVNHDTINTYYTTDNQIVTRIHDTIHTLNMASCDSTIWLALQIRRSSERHDTVANCYSYTWSAASGGNNCTYNTSGAYRDTLLRNRVGCDSIGILHLTINGDSAGTQDTIACSYFTFTDQSGTHLTYNDSTFTTHLHTVAGCDSTLTLNVMVINPHPGNETLTVCDSLIWHGTTYHTSTPRAVSPTLHDQYGCDSNSYLNLTVNYSVSSTINVTSCDQYYWGPSQTNYTRDTIARRTYPQTTNQGCDSTVELHLTILPSRTETAYDTTVCDTMYWNGRIYTTDGPYVQQLHTVRGNCDSIVTLNVTVKHASSATLTDTACDSYTWSVAHYNSGRRPFTVGTYITSGIYDTVVRNAMGCDSTITLQLTVFNRNSGILYDTACARYMWLGEYRNNSGIYRDTIETIHGCDSAVTLFLAIIPADTIRIPATACDTFTWRGTTYNTDTVVDDSYTNRFDCDSTIQLILTVHHRNTGDTSVSACDSYRWINDSTYKASSTDHFTIDRGNQYGCDSTITLHLSVSRSSMSAERQDVCDTFVWVNGDGNTYTQSDSIEYVMRGANVSGCDSTIKLFLTVRNSSVTVDNQVAYRSFTWVDSVTYTENTTTPRFNLGIPNAEGCDSVLELHLTLSPYPAPIINNIADLAVVVNHHPNGTAEYIDYIDYRWYCNDSLVSEGSDVYSSDRALQGAFYVEIPTSYARSTWFRSNTIYLNVSSIDGVEMSTTMELKAVPNPVSTQGILHVTTSLNPDECKNAMLYLYDLQGRLLTSVRPDGSQTDIPVNTSAGFYTLHLITNDGRHVATKIVVR